jgi:hypothetical protein
MAMTFDVNGFLDSRPIPIVEPSLADLVEAVEHSSRSRSRWIMLNLLRHADMPPRVIKATNRIKKCEALKWRKVSGYDRSYVHRCKHPLCPACTEWLSRVEAARIWQKLQSISDGSLQQEELSWLTVNIGHLPIGADFKLMAKSAVKAIRNKVNRRFPATVWAMELEIELQGDETGKLHVHGLIWHPGVTRQAIRDALQARFTEERAICIKPLRSRHLRREATRALMYKADVDLRLRGWGERTPEIESYESLRSRGRLGLRFEIGLRR